MFINPGGPGGSGVNFVYSAEEAFSRLRDASQRLILRLGSQPRAARQAPAARPAFRGLAARQSWRRDAMDPAGDADRNPAKTLIPPVPPRSYARGLQRRIAEARGACPGVTDGRHRSASELA